MNYQLLSQFLLYLTLTISLPCFSTEMASDISGTWLLDTQRSDNFQEIIKEKMKASGNSRRKPDSVSGASQGGKGQRPANTGQYANASGGNNRELIQNELKHIISFSEKIQISQNEPEIIMTLLEDEQRIIYTDGRGTTLSANDLTSGHEWPYIAGWTMDHQLNIETITNNMTIEERFTLSPDGKQLHSTINIKLSRIDDTITLIRIYDIDTTQ